ncbi:hypothetical protein Tco_0009962 [Tanacetum coccineum]
MVSSFPHRREENAKNRYKQEMEKDSIYHKRKLFTKKDGNLAPDGWVGKTLAHLRGMSSTTSILNFPIGKNQHKMIRTPGRKIEVSSSTESTSITLNTWMVLIPSQQESSPISSIRESLSATGYEMEGEIR